MSSVSSVTQASLISQINPQQAQQGWKTNMDSVLQSLGVDSSKIPTIEQKMHDAAQAAVKDGSSGQDQRANVKQALDTVLKNNGVDPTKFDAAMKAKMGKGGKSGKHHGHHKGGAQGVPAPSTPAQTSISALPSAQVDVEG